MPTHYTILEKHNGTGFNSDCRYWKVEVGGKVYFASVERGRRVKIAFKPRGQNYGWKWVANVRDERGQALDSPGYVSKGTGLAYLLEYAGLVPLRPSELAKIHNTALWDDHSRTRSLAGRGLAEGETCPCALCRKGV